MSKRQKTVILKKSSFNPLHIHMPYIAVHIGLYIVCLRNSMIQKQRSLSRSYGPLAGHRDLFPYKSLLQADIDTCFLFRSEPPGRACRACIKNLCVGCLTAYLSQIYMGTYKNVMASLLTKLSIGSPLDKSLRSLIFDIIQILYA